MLLFLTLCYLLILQRVYFPKYVDIAININRYLVFLFAVPFCLSLVISVPFLAASITGQAMGQTLTHGPGSEELKPTHEIVYSSATGEYTVSNKETGDRIHIPVEAKEKINTSTLKVERETGKDDDHSTGS